LEERIDAEVDSEDGILVRGVSPLKVVVSTDEERGVSETLVYSRKGSVVGAMDETIVRTIDL